MASSKNRSSKKQSSGAKKKPYSTPKFIVYGSINKITMKRRRTSDGGGRRT